MKELYSTEFKTVLRDDEGIFRSVRRAAFEVGEYICICDGEVLIANITKRGYNFLIREWIYSCVGKSIDSDATWEKNISQTIIRRPSNEIIKLMVEFIELRDKLKEAYALVDKSRSRILIVIEKLNAAGITVNY